MPRHTSITPQCREVLRFIVSYHNAHKFSPSQREICDRIDSLRKKQDTSETSTSTVKYHIDKLIDLGYLEGEGRIARGYAPTDAGREYVKEIQK